MAAVPMSNALIPILLTRPFEAAKRFEDQLRAAGITLPVVISPVLGIEPQEFKRPQSFAGAIFTSVNGVERVEGRDRPCWCVGESTAEVATAKGWRVVSTGEDAETLFRRILADAPMGPLLHFRGEHARGALASRLTEAGIETGERVVYRQVALPLDKEALALLMREKPLVLPLFSPRSAAQVVKQGPFRAQLHVIAMSEAVAQEAEALHGQSMCISKAPDAVSMIAAIKPFAGAA